MKVGEEASFAGWKLPTGCSMVQRVNGAKKRREREAISQKVGPGSCRQNWGQTQAEDEKLDAMVVEQQQRAGNGCIQDQCQHHIRQ